MDDLTNCPVCFEAYSETENIPRILPCHCTLCHLCVEKLLKDDKLQCPQDRQKHSAASGVKSFPQNKYVLKHLKSVSKRENSSFENCKEHGMDKVLFCKHQECQSAICATCMAKKHSTHPVGNILEETKNLLTTKVATLVEGLKSHNETLLKAQKQVEKICVDSIKVMQTQKESMCTSFHDKFVGNEEKQKVLCDIQNSISQDISYGDLREKLENVQLIESSSEINRPVVYEMFELKQKVHTFLDGSIFEKTGSNEKGGKHTFLAFSLL